MWLYPALYFVSLAITLTYSRSALFALILTWIITLCFVGEAFKKRLVGICILVALSFICIEHQAEITTENDIYIKELSYDWTDNKLRYGKAYLKRSWAELSADNYVSGQMVRKSSGRYNYWNDLLKINNPQGWLFGKGLLASHNIGSFTSTHSVYIYHYYHMGLLGLSVIICLQATTFFYAIIQYRKFNRNLFSIILIPGSIVLFAFNGNELIGSPEPYNILFWTPIMLTLAAEINLNNKSKQ